jgi:hypothetical protein
MLCFFLHTQIQNKYTYPPQQFLNYLQIHSDKLPSTNLANCSTSAISHKLEQCEQSFF